VVIGWRNSKNMGKHFYKFYDESDLSNWMRSKNRRVRKHTLSVDSKNTEDLFNIPIMGKKRIFKNAIF
jgi:hypothetical protein